MDGLGAHVEEVIATIQRALFDRALAFRDEHRAEADTYAKFKSVMAGRPGFVISPWCGSATYEASIKTETQSTIRNIPFASPPVAGKSSVACSAPATVHAWFAKCC